MFSSRNCESAAHSLPPKFTSSRTASTSRLAATDPQRKIVWPEIFRGISGESGGGCRSVFLMLIYFTRCRRFVERQVHPNALFRRNAIQGTAGKEDGGDSFCYRAVFSSRHSVWLAISFNNWASCSPHTECCRANSILRRVSRVRIVSSGDDITLGQQHCSGGRGDGGQDPVVIDLEG